MKKFLFLSIYLFFSGISADSFSEGNLRSNTEVELPGANTEVITLMQNFDPLEWEHVRINFDKINDLAHELAKIDPLKIADWQEILPHRLEIKELVEYVMGLICIDFCHWDFKLQPEENGVRDFFAKNELGIAVRGSAAMTELAKKAYNKGIKIFDSAFMKKVTMNDLRPHFTGMDHEEALMEIPWLEERVKILNEVGHILQEKWEGSFYNVLCVSEMRAFNRGKGFVELLIRNFPRFKDEYIYKNKKIGIYKLAQLSVMALQSTLSQYKGFSLFKDCDALTVCADYQLPRGLRALGILEYGPELIAYVDQERLISAGSSFEIELRMATVFAGEQLKEVMNQALADEGKPLISSQELDYLLWSYGRKLDCDKSKHHLTRTMMY